MTDEENKVVSNLHSDEVYQLINAAPPFFIRFEILITLVVILILGVVVGNIDYPVVSKHKMLLIRGNIYHGEITMNDLQAKNIKPGQRVVSDTSYTKQNISLKSGIVDSLISKPDSPGFFVAYIGVKFNNISLQNVKSVQYINVIIYENNGSLIKEMVRRFTNPHDNKKFN